MNDNNTKDVLARFASAQQALDLHALDALLADDFMLVGPLGFMLDKSQLLDQLRGGSLHFTSLTIEPVVSRSYGGATVVIGVQEQAGSYGDRPVDGHFRVTLVVFDGTLASMHLSPIAGPPTG